MQLKQHENKLSKVTEGGAYSQVTWYGVNHGEQGLTTLSQESNFPQLNVLSFQYTVTNHERMSTVLVI